jgi:hypothetical protein
MVVVLRINKEVEAILQTTIECSKCNSLLLIDKDECIFLPSDDVRLYPNRYKIYCPMCNEKIFLYDSHFGILKL